MQFRKFTFYKRKKGGKARERRKEKIPEAASASFIAGI
jgi:hypothetical protein